MSCDSEACLFPFTVAEINGYGDVYGCCASVFIGYCFGNIFEQPFDEIWNGEKAQKFRQQFIDQQFNYCDFNFCAKEWKKFTPTKIVDYPIRVQLDYDASCNARCIYCREKPYPPDFQKFEEHTEDIILPLLKNAKLVNVTARGEIFASNSSKKLINRISEVYPDIKFYVYTNGIECSPEKLSEYGLVGKVEYFVVSIPALTKKIYNKLVVGGNYDKVIKNIKFLGKLKSQNKIKDFILNFVVNSYNYKEMPGFVNFAKENSAKVSFLKLNKQPDNVYIYDKIAIAEEFHPEHKKYLEAMRNPIFKQPHVNKTNTFTTLNLQ